MPSSGVTYYTWGDDVAKIAFFLAVTFKDSGHAEALACEFEYIAKRFAGRVRMSNVAMGGAVLNALDWAYDRCNTNVDLRLVCEQAVDSITKAIQSAADTVEPRD